MSAPNAKRTVPNRLQVGLGEQEQTKNQMLILNINGVIANANDAYDGRRRRDKPN